jgi:hypothetical protein
MPAEEFLAVAEQGDAALAGRFGVPIEQAPPGAGSSARGRTGWVLPLIDRPAASGRATRPVGRFLARTRASTQLCNNH